MSYLKGARKGIVPREYNKHIQGIIIKPATLLSDELRFKSGSLYSSSIINSPRLR